MLDIFFLISLSFLHFVSFDIFDLSKESDLFDEELAINPTYESFINLVIYLFYAAKG